VVFGSQTRFNPLKKLSSLLNFYEWTSPMSICRIKFNVLITEKKTLSIGSNSFVFSNDLSLGYYVVVVNDGKDRWSEKLLIR